MSAMRYESNLGRVLRLWRKTNDLPLREAAREMGLTLACLASLEVGRRQPNAETFLKLFRWFLSKPNGRLAQKR